MAKGLAAIVLAAGSSKRMGSINKLLLPFGEESIIRTSLKKMLNCKLESVFVVLGHQYKLLQKEIEDLPVHTVLNQEYERGIGTSIAQGFQKIKSLGFRGCMLCLGDLPLLEIDHFDCMINAYETDTTERIYVPYYRGKQGHPIIFPYPWFGSLCCLQGDKGAKQVITQNADSVHKVEFNDLAGLEDVDTYDRYLAFTGGTAIKDNEQNKKEKKQSIKPLENEDYYMNEQGLMVFTEKYHLKRGYCCESGCLHCPYGFNKLS